MLSGSTVFFGWRELLVKLFFFSRLGVDLFAVAAEKRCFKDDFRGIDLVGGDVVGDDTLCRCWWW
jgi:hypothetical protein